jgi:hypothetical protein
VRTSRRALLAGLTLALPLPALVATDAMASSATKGPTHKPVHHASTGAGKPHTTGSHKPSSHLAQVHHSTPKKTTTTG